MSTKQKPVLALLAAPLMMSIVTGLAIVGGTMLEERYLDPVSTFPRAPITYDWAPWLAVLCAVSFWFAGRWLVRRAPLRATTTQNVLLFSVCYLMLGVAVPQGIAFAVGFGFLFMFLVLPYAGLAMASFGVGYLLGHPDVRAASGRSSETPSGPDTPPPATA